MAMQQGGFYWNPQAKQAQQFWNGKLGPPGQIMNPAQRGSGGGGGGGGGGSFGGSGASSQPSTPSFSLSSFAQNTRDLIEKAKNRVLGINPTIPQSQMAKPTASNAQLPQGMTFGTSANLQGPGTSQKPPSSILPANPAQPKAAFAQGTPSQLQPLIQNASQKYNVPTAILSSLLKQESGFNPNAKSPAGAQGIAQFMPSTAQGMGINPWDPAQSIEGAAKYLRNSLDQFGGSIEKALASYNAGSGAVQQYGGVPPYQETQNYVKNILAMANQAQPLNESTALPTPGNPDFYDQAMAKLNSLQGQLSSTPPAQENALLSRYDQMKQNPAFISFLNGTGGNTAGGSAQLSSAGPSGIGTAPQPPQSLLTQAGQTKSQGSGDQTPPNTPQYTPYNGNYDPFSQLLAYQSTNPDEKNKFLDERKKQNLLS